MSQPRRHSPRSIWIAILLVCCVLSLVGLGVGGYIAFKSANPQIEPTLTETVPTLTVASYTATPP